MTFCCFFWLFWAFRCCLARTFSHTSTNLEKMFRMDRIFSNKNLLFHIISTHCWYKSMGENQEQLEQRGKTYAEEENMCSWRFSILTLCTFCLFCVYNSQAYGCKPHKQEWKPWIYCSIPIVDGIIALSGWFGMICLHYYQRRIEITICWIADFITPVIIFNS